jgi:hypothetical protein
MTDGKTEQIDEADGSQGEPSISSTSQSEVDKVDEAGEAIEDAQEDVGRGMQWYARAYTTVLFSILIIGLVATVHFGIVSPSVTVSATLELGWLLEYVAIFIAALFTFFTASMALIALPIGFVSGILSAAARIADANDLQNE